MLETWDRWFEEDGQVPIIGLKTDLFPAIVIGVQDERLARMTTDLAFKVLGIGFSEPIVAFSPERIGPAGVLEPPGVLTLSRAIWVPVGRPVHSL
jgi:hypothetical protein